MRSHNDYFLAKPINTEEYMALHLALHSLVQIAYLELVYRLFSIYQHHPGATRWLRSVQLILLIYPILEFISNSENGLRTARQT